MKSFRNAQEAESGNIRRDPAWLCGRRDDPGTGEEAWSSSPDGTAGDRQRDPAGTKAGGKRTTPSGTGKGDHQPDSGRRPEGAAETETHSTSDLHPTERRTSGVADRRADGTPLCGGTEAGTGTERPRRFCAAELSGRPGRAGGLVRSHGEVGWGTLRTAVFRDAQHGIRRCLSPRLYQRNTTSISGRTRTRLRLLWRCIPNAALRQPDQCSKENPAGTAARGDQSGDRVPITLGIPKRILQSSVSAGI